MLTLSVLAAIAWEPASGERFLFCHASRCPYPPLVTAAEVLKACAEQAKLPFLVIGGFAVIAHGYQRTTMDLDPMVRRANASSWTETLRRIGYDVNYTHPTFARYHSSGAIDVDVMYVNDETFDGMFAAAMPTVFQGVAVKVPSIEHLLALKLHVSKQELRHRPVRLG